MMKLVIVVMEAMSLVLGLVRVRTALSSSAKMQAAYLVGSMLPVLGMAFAIAATAPMRLLWLPGSPHQNVPTSVQNKVLRRLGRGRRRCKCSLEPSRYSISSVRTVVDNGISCLLTRRDCTESLDRLRVPSQKRRLWHMQSERQRPTGNLPKKLQSQNKMHQAACGDRQAGVMEML